jgi:hypothetical protein
VAQPDFQFLAGHRKIALDDAPGAATLPVLGQPLEQKLALDFLMLRRHIVVALKGIGRVSQAFASCA